MRRFWLKADNGTVWNLAPDNPRDTRNGCFFGNVAGLGLENDFAQTQVKVDYFIDNVLSKNVNISGVLYFSSDRHVDSFYNFIQDTQRTFELHYSPDGRIIATDQISASWYKPCGIVKLEKRGKNFAGWYECPVTFKTQSDVWRRDIFISSSQPEPFGEALVYPFFYEYEYGGAAVWAVNITNAGREVEPIIEIINGGETAVENPYWVNEHISTDVYDREVKVFQRARFNIALHAGRTLLVDSRAIANGLSAQRAVILNNSDGRLMENVYNRQQIDSIKGLDVTGEQEIDFDFINFISLPTGENRLYFDVGGQQGVNIKISYQENRELI